jgi:hypothetical protein
MVIRRWRRCTVLRLTADVNGHPIAHVFVHNTGRRGFGFYTYDAAVYYPESDGMVLGFEDIVHRRSDGWIPLALRVLELIYGPRT